MSSAQLSSVAATAPRARTPDEGRLQFARDVVEGLSRPRKALPGKYLWDETGSDLFDRICRTQDYYLTRRETALLGAAAEEFAGMVGPGATLVEYGSGASRKVRLLLDAMDRPRRYLALDISAEYLGAATRRIAADYPALEVRPVVADYTRPIALPGPLGDGPMVGFFPGSTIGNFADEGVVAFMERARATLGGGWFLIGHDPNQDEASLRRAYGEADGLMAALHLNILSHVNAALGGDFDPSAFRHEIRVERDPMRVEAYITATRAGTYRVAGRSFAIAEGETIHTDMAYKLAPEAFCALARRAGWATARTWLDADGRYALHLLRSL